jgi:response regulator RpfG family c-di-GMP phosphodiesterase
MLVTDVLAWFGAAGDAAVGNASGFAARKAALGVAIAQTAEFPQSECDAIYYAGLLHAAGAIGNQAYRKGPLLPERIKRMESWDVPAQGARICESIGALPPETHDIVRWQHEAWDGTGYPDSLRWTGIPKPAQVLGLADRFLTANDPEEALSHIGLESGRVFNPAAVRAFTMWFHRAGGEIDPLDAPLDALRDAGPPVTELLDSFADRIDAHNRVEGRWRRVARIAEATAQMLALDDAQQRALAIACRIFGAGELDAEDEEDSDFDPLARLGLDHRARNAMAGAALALPFPALRAAAEIVGSRGEWYDGTGKPDGLMHGKIPAGSAVLAAAIAYDRLDRKARIDEAAGTQFDPQVVRSMLEAAKLRA